jgi:hypothetical protein
MSVMYLYEYEHEYLHDVFVATFIVVSVKKLDLPSLFSFVRIICVFLPTVTAQRYACLAACVIVPHFSAFCVQLKA